MVGEEQVSMMEQVFRRLESIDTRINDLGDKFIQRIDALQSDLREQYVPREVFEERLESHGRRTGDLEARVARNESLQQQQAADRKTDRKWLAGVGLTAVIAVLSNWDKIPH